ncbi:MAG: hypothetical protein VX764_03615 [Planctomycetota bacterium]|nr:hypothetical protein [Planctomycetota bacterium]
MQERTGTITLVESYGHLLAWGLLLCWALLTGGIRAASAPVVVAPQERSGAMPGAETVDLRRDPVGRLVLIDGIGEVTAQRIVAGRRSDGGYQCLCQILQLPGVPDRPLLEAGPWLLPRPCISGSCRTGVGQEPALRSKR